MRKSAAVHCKVSIEDESVLIAVSGILMLTD